MNKTGTSDIYGSQRISPHKTWAPHSRREVHQNQKSPTPKSPREQSQGPFVSDPGIRHPPKNQQMTLSRSITPQQTPTPSISPRYSAQASPFAPNYYLPPNYAVPVQMMPGEKPYGIAVEAGKPVESGMAVVDAAGVRAVVIKTENGVAEVMTLFQMLASLTGFVAGAMAITLGVFHLCKSYASLSWPHKFLDDVNADTWRMSIFSLVPSVFIDIWTPLIFGCITILVHLKEVKLSPLGVITKNYIVYGVWLVVQALWGCMGYRGGLGISVGIFSLLAAALCLLVGILGGDAEASILFDYKAYAKTKESYQNDEGVHP